MRQSTPKPCPFCKCDDVWIERYGLCTYAVVCGACAVHGPKVEHGKYCDEPNGNDLAERDAIRMWNARSENSHRRVMASCEMVAASEI